MITVTVSSSWWTRCKLYWTCCCIAKHSITWRSLERVFQRCQPQWLSVVCCPVSRRRPMWIIYDREQVSISPASIHLWFVVSYRLSCYLAEINDDLAVLASFFAHEMLHSCKISNNKCVAWSVCNSGVLVTVTADLRHWVMHSYLLCWSPMKIVNLHNML